MPHCISVTLKDGSTVRANVPNGVTTLPVTDMQALEDWVSYVKDQHKKKNHENKKTKSQKI